MISFLFLVFLFYHSFIINVSSSEPLGLYQIQRESSLHRGDIVAVCLSPSYQQEGLGRGYLLPGIRCHGAAPLIKTVVSIPGDTVILTRTEIRINGKNFPCVTKVYDSHGFTLQTVRRGVYKNSQQYWLIGTNDVNSWDSRYWGGVERTQILYRLKHMF